MSQGDTSYVAIKSSETAPSGTGWREGVLVLVIVLAPMGLAVIVMAIGLAARAAWLAVYGMPAGLPPAASIRLYGLLSYAVGSWIAVGLAWLWSKRQDLRRDAFLFRRLTAPALAAGIVSFAILASVCRSLRIGLPAQRVARAMTFASMSVMRIQSRSSSCFL